MRGLIFTSRIRQFSYKDSSIRHTFKYCECICHKMMNSENVQMIRTLLVPLFSPNILRYSLRINVCAVPHLDRSRDTTGFVTQVVLTSTEYEFLRVRGEWKKCSACGPVTTRWSWRRKLCVRRCSWQKKNINVGNRDFNQSFKGWQNCQLITWN